MSWALGRKLLYLMGVCAFLAVLIGVPVYFALQEEPTCFDGLMNQNERGVDCGGVCQVLCPHEVKELDVLWSRSFKVTDGVYNAVAYVENPNFTATVRNLPYLFELYDEKNVLIAEREGTVTLSTDGATPIFEPGIRTGSRIPIKTFFRFANEKRWVDVPGGVKPTIEIVDKTLTNPDSSPRVFSTIRNNSPDEQRNVEVIAIVYDSFDNAIAASKTEIPLFAPRSDRSAVFTWPGPLSATTTLRLEVVAKIPL